MTKTSKGGIGKVTVKAWAGFSDRELYLRFDPVDDKTEYCIYKTRAKAKKDFDDVRPCTITYLPPKDIKKKR